MYKAASAEDHFGSRALHQSVPSAKSATMPQGDKTKYSDKQVKEAEHIAKGYQHRGKDEKTSKAIAWATVNKVHDWTSLT